MPQKNDMAARRILIVTPFGFTGRLSNFVESVSARLLSASGWQVSALTRFEERQKDDARVEEGISVHRYRTTVGALVQLLSIYFFERPMIVHVHMLRNNRIGIVAAMLAKLLRKQLLFTEHGLLHDPYLTDNREDPLHSTLHIDGIVKTVDEIFRKKGRIRALLKNYLYHWAMTHADANVFVSTHNMDIAKKVGIQNGVYLPYLVDSFRWGAVRDAHADTPKQLADASYALFVGQLKDRKGWDIALDTIALVPRDTLRYLAVVSSSSAEAPPHFTDALAARRVSDRVLYFGRVEDAQLSALYRGAKVVLIPSRYEGFGLPAVEALSFERPIVASDVPELNVFLENGTNALLVPPNDPVQCASAVVRLVSDTGLAQRLVRGGRATHLGMRDERIAAEWRAFYEAKIS